MKRLVAIFALLLLLAAAATADYWPSQLFVCSSGQGVCTQVPNAASTGTINNGLAVFTGAPSTLVTPSTTITATQQLAGLVLQGAGTSGNALLLVSGYGLCQFDGATTANDLFGYSSTTAGQCKDLGGSTAATLANLANVCLGVVQSTNGGAGTYQVLLGEIFCPGLTRPQSVTRVLTSGTTYTPPAGTTQLLFELLGGAGGGGAATSGGATAVSGGSGGGGTEVRVLFNGSIAATYTYAIGPGGNAGTCAASPVAATGGTTTSVTANFPTWVAATVEAVGNAILDSNSHVQVVTAITSDNKTGNSPPTWATSVGASTTDNHVTWVEYEAAVDTLSAPGGGAGGTASTSTAGSAGGAGAGITGASGIGPNASVISKLSGVAGTIGNTSSVPVIGTSQQTTGGSSASVTSGGACSAVATAGQNGYIIATAMGNF